MNNEELNTALYEKMFAAQETYRAWLLSQTPEEILNHTYEYTVREDILMSLEYHNLPDGQARALLKSPSPLADVFADWENKETDYMDSIMLFCFRDSGIRKGRHFMILKWRLFLFPETTATIRNEVKSCTHKSLPSPTRKGAMCQWHMFSTDRSGSGEALAKQQPVRTWE